MQIDFKCEKIWLWSEAVDFRKSIDGLCALVVERMKDNPGEGMYIFCNRSRNKLKILGWHGNGFILVYKRLGKGKFTIAGGELNERQLSWLLAGFDWQVLGNWDKANFSDYF